MPFNRCETEPDQYTFPFLTMSTYDMEPVHAENCWEQFEYWRTAPTRGREGAMRNDICAPLIDGALYLQEVARALSANPRANVSEAARRAFYNFGAASQLGRLMLGPSEFTHGEKPAAVLQRHRATKFDFGFDPKTGQQLPVAIHMARKNADYLLPSDRQDGDWYKLSHDYLYVQFSDQMRPQPELPGTIDFDAEFRPKLEPADAVTLYPYLSNR